MSTFITQQATQVRIDDMIRAAEHHALVREVRRAKRARRTQEATPTRPSRKLRVMRLLHA